MTLIKAKLAVHKFSSCDGCQLAILNDSELLLGLASEFELVHFLEAGFTNEGQTVDVALVEGSISTARDIERIQSIRQNSRLLVAMGACATSGGLQALRNKSHLDQWQSRTYSFVPLEGELDKACSIHDYVKVDASLHGCPVDSRQVSEFLAGILKGYKTRSVSSPLCMECKRSGFDCVLITKNAPCIGAITREGCGALCPSMGRACYGCYGPLAKSSEKSPIYSLLEEKAGVGRERLTSRMHVNSDAFRKVLK